jgi:hypothetical protein
MERGLSATIAGLTNVDESSIRRALVTLQKRGFLTKLDEFSCQVSNEFMQKTSKKIKYKGAVQGNPNEDESVFLFKVHTLAIENWEIRGKNHKIFTKDEDKEMIKQLTKELKQERIQSAERHSDLKSDLKRVLDALDKLSARYNDSEAIEVVRHLKLVQFEGGKE